MSGTSATCGTTPGTRGARCRPAGGSSRTSIPRTRIEAADPQPARCRGAAQQLVHVEPRDATIDEVCRFHSRAYVDKIQALSDDNGGDAGFLTAFGPGSFEIALRSAGGAIAAIDAVLDGAVDNCYALVRPPGHHAIPGSGMGFCLLGNIAIAAHHARQARGLARVAVVDWDVHHGNGTQAAFYDDPSVLTISLHQDNCFPPGSGPISDTGRGRARATTSTSRSRPGRATARTSSFERVVVPALRAFRPELIVIASGFDASGMDPLGRQLLHSESYRELTRWSWTWRASAATATS